jgi:hypothetical protein
LRIVGRDLRALGGDDRSTLSKRARLYRQLLRHAKHGREKNAKTRNQAPGTHENVTYIVFSAAFVGRHEAIARLSNYSASAFRGIP